MTQREFYEAIIEANVNEEITEFATKSIETLDKRNETRREKAAEKAVAKEAEKAPIREAVLAVITAEPKTASTLIAEAGVEIKPQAIPSLLKPLIEDGVIYKADVKVKGKGTQRGYALTENAIG
jgi:hypothetical protein